MNNFELRFKGKHTICSMEYIVSICLVITAFLYMKPYFVWSTYEKGSFSYLPSVFIILSTIILIIYFMISKRIIINRQHVYINLSFIILWCYMLITGDSNEYLNVGNYLLILVLCLFFSLKNELKVKIFNMFAWVFALSLLSSIIVWILLAFNITLPHDILQSWEEGKVSIGGYYEHYFLSVVRREQVRTATYLTGVYDEQGVVGTFSGLFLVADNLEIKGKVRNIIIFIGGILSFSLAFYIILFIGLAFKLGLKRFRRLIIFLLIIGIAFYILMNIKTDNIIITEFFQNRFKLINGKWVGDNRTNEVFNSVFQQFLESAPIKTIFGNGRNRFSIDGLNSLGSFTYKFLIYDYGYLGLVLIIAWIIFSSLLVFGSNNLCVPLLVVFIASIYQRPFVITIPYLLLLFSGYSNLLKKNYFNKN